MGRPGVLMAGLAGIAAAAGWTLVEVLIALTIAGLVSGLALPQFRNWIAAYELMNHARNLAGSMTLARTEAVKRGFRVNLCKSPDRHQCADAGGWEAGWLIFADVDRDGRVGDDEPVLRIEGSAPQGITVRANRPLDDYVSYTSLGHARLLSGALQMGTFVVCRPGQNAIKVVLANSGRVRTEKTRDPC